MENHNVRLTDAAREFLRETAKWAHFLSIVGFVFLGLMVIFALFVGSMMSTIGAMGGVSSDMGMSSFLTVFYLLFAALYFFPIYYLFKFAANTRHALAINDEATLENALGYLKSHYKFMGILTIVLIALYILAIAFTVLAGASALM